MKLCIAEKPSVARDIAKIIGANTSKQGYMEGNGYWVTWTYGHLCTLKEPQDYDPSLKYWNLYSLPIIPKKFGIKLIKNSNIERQFNIIKKLVEECEEVINCGDAGQEGELIQRWVLQKAKCQKPVKRLWISSLTEEAITEGFQKLKPQEQYNQLYAAGNARAIGDWLLGINATRLFTKKYGTNKNVLSIGRVQTPTLAMIVKRWEEINKFVTETYWELKTIYRDTTFTANINRIKSQEKANKGLEYIKNHPLKITSFEIKEGKEKNPKLFDLTALQVEANKKYAYSAEQTLNIAQSLYEKKHITYPRVDTTYLAENIYPKIEGILKQMKPYQKLITPILQKEITKHKHIFDDNKITDHHAIIPTNNTPNTQISQDEKKIYNLIAKRFIAVFYPECKVSNTIVEATIGEIPFKTQGKQILEMGWKKVYENEQKTNTENTENEIPIFQINEQGPHSPQIHHGKTTPPKHYTEATLLRAMETAGKHIEDEDLRESLKNNGIGRPSTRANIIETLYKRKYIEKKRKNIIATPTGISLINTIEDKILKSPELTGEWELKLRKIEKNEYNANIFKEELIDMVKEITKNVINSKGKNITITEEENKKQTKDINTTKEKKYTDLDKIQCPKCKKYGIIKGKKAYGCMNYNTCNFVIPYHIFGKKLTEKQVIDLITKNKTTTIKGFTELPNKKTAARLTLDSSFEITIYD